MRAMDTEAGQRGGGGRPRIGFFGGSFDPPHRGHLELARVAVAAAGLERLFFLPAARNPLKADGPAAPGERRVEMLEAAIGGDPTLGVIDWELHRPPPSYSVDTVRHLRGRFPGAELCWLIGADQLGSLQRWFQIEELATLVRFLVLARPGFEPVETGVNNIALEWVPAPRIDVSSTVVRALLRDGLPVDNLVPLPVLELLRQHPDLYFQS